MDEQFIEQKSLVGQRDLQKGTHNPFSTSENQDQNLWWRKYLLRNHTRSFPPQMNLKHGYKPVRKQRETRDNQDWKRNIIILKDH